jgi:hypothetical protein
MARQLRIATDGDALPEPDSLKRMIWRWERAGLRNERYGLLYAKALGIGPDDLADGPSGLPISVRLPASGHGEPYSHGAGMIPAPTAPHSDDAVDVLSRIQKIRRSAVHPDIISHLQDDMRYTVMQYENLEHSSLIPALRKQRAWVESLIDECGHPAQRRELFEIAGITSGVLGYVAVGGGKFDLARAYCLEAFQLGEFAGDFNIQAWARGLQSFCEYYAGRYDKALMLASDGLDYARSGPQSVRLKINGAARALAKLGDVKGVERAVEEAHELMSLNDAPSGVPSSISLDCYSAAQIASNAATAYLAVAIPEKVQYYAGLALPEISKSNSPWSHSLVLIDVATSCLRSKEADLDHASALVHDALVISMGRPVISVQQRATEFLHDIIGRWGNIPQSRTIRDTISALGE